MINSMQYIKALSSGVCLSCGNVITNWQRIKRVFWGPIFCPTSMIWKVCCSQKCWGDLLEKQLKELTKETDE